LAKDHQNHQNCCLFGAIGCCCLLLGALYCVLLNVLSVVCCCLLLSVAALFNLVAEPGKVKKMVGKLAASWKGLKANQRRQKQRKLVPNLLLPNLLLQIN
jgi:hypothetical protein